MKHILFVVVAALGLMLASPVYAVTDAVGCANVAAQARVAMTARQGGLPMEKAMAAASTSQVMAWLVEKAYEVPLQATPSDRADIANEYGNFMYRICIKAAAPKPVVNKPELSV